MEKKESVQQLENQETSNDKPEEVKETKKVEETKEVQETKDVNQEKDKKENEETQTTTSETQEPNMDLFKSYMQCFQGQSENRIKSSRKWDQLCKERKFWDTQPVIKVREANKIRKTGPIKTKEQHEITDEPTKLPSGFKWRNFNLKDDTDIKDLYYLLYENYVEDDGGVFRFNYSKEFLQWALMPPGYDKDLYFGITYTNKKKEVVLVGFISGIILNVNLEDKVVPLTEVNFLCVHKKYRKFSMASVLIREVVRRSNTKDIFQGLFTSGTMLPTPFAQTRYWHRSLNPEKLIKVNINTTF